MIDGIFKLSQSDEHLPTNIGNPTELTIHEFAEKVLTHFPNAAKIVYEPLPVDDPKQRRPDISKAKRLLDWEPKVGLDEGLKITIAFFKEQYEKKTLCGPINFEWSPIFRVCAAHGSTRCYGRPNE